MKKLIYIFIVLILVSCNNHAEKNIDINVLEMNEGDYEVEISESGESIENSFIYENLSSQKLQEMYDLISLKLENPEFEETIKLQLKTYTNDSISIPNSSGVLIKNIKLKGEVIKVSDSVQKMKLYYDVVSNNSIQKDSIWATITINETMFEGKKIKSKKIKFNSL